MVPWSFGSAGLFVYNNFMNNNSPWIRQLNNERQTQKLEEDVLVDVSIVGAGIAGVSTAFFLLKHTDKKIAIVESGKLAHGATGHNAGQLVSYFERPFSEIVEEFGLEMASQAQNDVNLAWELMDEMYTEAGLDIPLNRFVGYAGLSNFEQVIKHLENNFLRRSGGLFTHPIEVWEDAPFLKDIPEKYHNFLTLVPREEIALKLETLDPQYVAVLSAQKGLMNSALFCQEVVSYLSKKYPERFAIFEHTPVIKVLLKEVGVWLDTERHLVKAESVVLCTNGFENFDILAPSGLAISSDFHLNLSSVVGFMSGYLDSQGERPSAISYYSKKAELITDNPGDPYFYITRRAYEYEKEQKHNLVLVGGPDFELEERAHYDGSLAFSDKAKSEIDEFIKETYDKRDSEYAFMWHGVMGYTRNLLRMVGPDPDFPRLFYNLGCNGVGLLPSIFGGQKVARQIAGENFPLSIFDIPKRQSSKHIF